MTAPELTAAQREELRGILDKDLAKLERSMRVTEEALKPAKLDQTAVGRLSRMDTLQGQGLTRNLQGREQVRLAQIQEALQRMADGTYGACTACGEAIPFERLLVFPESPECGACPGH